MPNKFGLHKDRDSRFFFTLSGEDGTELLRGLTHFTASHAHKDARSAKRLLQSETNLVRIESHGKHYFVLRDEKGQQVARSLHVRGPLALEEIVKESMAIAPQAMIVDTTHLSRSYA